MRIANSNDRRLFVGNAVVCGHEVYVNVADGTGFKKVFELMQDMIRSLSKHRCAGSDCRSLDDAYQDVCVSVLEGMAKYQPDRHASLSTFLYMFVQSRNIDSFRKLSADFEEFQDIVPGRFVDPADRIDAACRIREWDDNWKNVVFRLFVNEEDVASVANDIGMTPWGLTRAVRRKLRRARNT